MLLTFQTNFEQVFVVYVQLICLRICCLHVSSCAFLHTAEEKKHISDTKHIAPQDQTYSFFNYLIGSFIKRQTSNTSSDKEWYNEWQGMKTSRTTSDNE